MFHPKLFLFHNKYDVSRYEGQVGSCRCFDVLLHHFPYSLSIRENVKFRLLRYPHLNLNMPLLSIFFIYLNLSTDISVPHSRES